MTNVIASCLKRAAVAGLVVLVLAVPGIAVADPSGQMSTGTQHTCARKPDGSIWCWGSNFYGEVGDGTSTYRLVPVQTMLGASAFAVSGGSDGSCALIADGSVQCWGADDYDLGFVVHATNLLPYQIPLGVSASLVSGPTINTYIVGDVAFTTYHTCIRGTDGSLWCWGHNPFGELGDGTTVDALDHAVHVTALGNSVVSVATGAGYTCITKTDRSLWCVGMNSYGTLGDGTNMNRQGFVAVSSLGSTVSSVSAGYNHTCATKTDGTLWCWGDNSLGEIGDGTTTNRWTPVAVPTLGTSVAQVSVGLGFHTCARKSDGTVWCWGSNELGNLGIGTYTSTDYRTSPVQVMGLAPSVVEISAGEYHTCARQPDDSLWCWGRNGDGQLGDGTGGFTGINVRASPVQVVGFGAATAAVPTSGPGTEAVLAIALLVLACGLMRRPARIARAPR
jgi:alpha-tubulin suppressor-like RCC1 family protein